MARKPVLLHLSAEELARLDALVAEKGQSRSAVVRDAIERYVQQESIADRERRDVEGYTRAPQDAEFDALHDLAKRQLNEDLPY